MIVITMGLDIFNLGVVDITMFVPTELDGLSREVVFKQETAVSQFAQHTLTLHLAPAIRRCKSRAANVFD